MITLSHIGTHVHTQPRMRTAHKVQHFTVNALENTVSHVVERRKKEKVKLNYYYFILFFISVASV